MSLARSRVARLSRRRFAAATPLALALAVAVAAGATLGAPRAAEAAGTKVTIDGLSSTVPERWKELPTQGSMRFKQFLVPREKGDSHDGELVIFFFGPGGGGGAQANIDRWKGMFQPPEGKTIDQVSKVETKDVGKVKTTVLDVRGTYNFKASPMAPGPGEPRPNYRMLAIVFESPQGPYFFRFVGPQKTIDKNKKDFDKWLNGFK
jgi:hypothetical protein